MSFPYRTRRTIKPAAMDPTRTVPEDVLHEILEDAHWAPTHGLTQPWRFHIFTGAARERLANALEAIHDRITDPPRPEKRAKFRANTLAAPAVVAVAVRFDTTGKISELDEIAAAACAVQNLLLSAHERGIASFWATPPAACGAEFAEWLGNANRGLGLVFLGHARDAAPPASARVPLEERATFHAE
jgi:nitroreductase